LPLETQLDVRIRSRPHQRNPRHPVLAVDRLSRPRMLLRRQDLRRCCELRAGDFSAYRTRRHAHLRIVADPLRLPHVAASHHVELAVLFTKPHRSGDAHAVLAKCRQRNVFLIVDRLWYLARHTLHPRRSASSPPLWLSSLVQNCRRGLLPSLHLCYKPEHA
jgi:hypothetical protein